MDIWTWQSYLMILLIPFRHRVGLFSVRILLLVRRGRCRTQKKTLMIMMTIKYTHISFDVIRCASDITGTRSHTLLLRWPTFDERAPSSHPPAAESTAPPPAMCLNRAARRFHSIRLEQPRSAAMASSVRIVFQIIVEIVLLFYSLCVGMWLAAKEAAVSISERTKNSFASINVRRIFLLLLRILVSFIVVRSFVFEWDCIFRMAFISLISWPFSFHWCIHNIFYHPIDCAIPI